VAGVIAILKFKFLIFGALKTSLSMLLMIWVYSWMFGWLFALGFVFLLLVHEMGHVVAAKLLGIPVSAPLFIPFLGAAIIMKQNPRDAWTEALMAYGGPLAGCIGSWICWAIALQTGETWLMAVASVSFVLNLFNMIPVPRWMEVGFAPPSRPGFGSSDFSCWAYRLFISTPSIRSSSSVSSFIGLFRG